MSSPNAASAKGRPRLRAELLKCIEAGDSGDITIQSPINYHKINSKKKKNRKKAVRIFFRSLCFGVRYTGNIRLKDLEI